MQRSPVVIAVTLAITLFAFILGISLSASLQAAPAPVAGEQQRPKTDAQQEEPPSGDDPAVAESLRRIADSLGQIAENSSKIGDIEKRLVEIIERLEGIEEELAWTRLDRGKELPPAKNENRPKTTGKR